MSLSPLTPDPAPRDAEHANEAIRDFLWARQGRGLLAEERVEYTRLLGVYLRAVRGETVRGDAMRNEMETAA